MNPARSLGPAIVHHDYRGIWIYIVSPIFGALAGTWTYNFIRIRKKNKSTTPKLTKVVPFIKGAGKNGADRYTVCLVYT